MIRMTLTVMIVLATISSAIAQDFDKLKLGIDHLKIVNSQWEGIEEFAPQEIVSFESEEHRIEYHLMCVINYLAVATDVTIDQSVLNRRRELINSLERYADDRIFPQNIHHSNRQPYFIDHIGTHCAVGQLMANSGNEALAQEISDSFNYNYIEEIDHDGVASWAAEQGFLIEELKLIQPSYFPTNQHETPGDGCNAPVDVIVQSYNDANNRLYMKGVFSEIAGGNACDGLAYYENETLHCVEPAIQGSVVDITAGNGKLIVFGQLENEGSIYPMATLENDAWTYTTIPDREGYGASAFHYNWELNQLYLVLETGVESEREVWINSYYNGWELLVTVDGEVRCSEDFFGVVFAGDFESFKNEVDGSDWSDADLLQIQYADFFDPVINPFTSEEIPQNIYSMASKNGELVLAIGTENVLLDDILFAYLNPSFETTNSVSYGFLSGNYLICAPENSPFYIYDMIDYDDDNLLLAGEFCMLPGLYHASGLSTLQNEYPAISVALLDGPVKTCVKIGDELYYGGEFLTNSYEGDFGELIDQPVEYFGTNIIESDIECEDVEESVFVTKCLGDSVLIDGEYYFDTNFGEQVFQTSLGCDSIVATFYIFSEPANEYEASMFACDGESVLIDGEMQSTPGVYETYETDFGGCVSKLVTNFEIVSCDAEGCTHPLADNYSPFAIEDDGSCLFGDVEGVCGSGTVWDASLEACVVSCPADMNGDNAVNTNDLLAFLSAFGSNCD